MLPEEEEFLILGTTGNSQSVSVKLKSFIPIHLIGCVVTASTPAVQLYEKVSLQFTVVIFPYWQDFPQIA